MLPEASTTTPLMMVLPSLVRGRARGGLWYPWTVMIVVTLLDGTKRFGELRDVSRASPEVLTAALRDLERDGLVERRIYADPFAASCSR